MEGKKKQITVKINMLFKPLDVLLPMTVFDRMSWGGTPPYLGEPED